MKFWQIDKDELKYFALKALVYVLGIIGVLFILIAFNYIRYYWF